MKLFLVRHGETVDNVAGVYAGITDSALTNHGVLQAERLGQHLAERGICVGHIFSSDLQRAYRTAEAIRLAQSRLVDCKAASETKRLVDLREQDFGFYEGKTFYERSKDSNKSGKEAQLEPHRNDPGFKDVETRDAMKIRSDRFIDEHLLGLLAAKGHDNAIVIVAHGIILSHLWRCLLRRFHTKSVRLEPGVVSADRHLALEYLGGWSNTGYLELELRRADASHLDSPLPSKRKWEDEDVDQEESNIPEDLASSPLFHCSGDVDLSVTPSISSAPKEIVSPLRLGSIRLSDMTLVVKAVNCLAHLKGLKKTRGGIGSLKHDEGQKTIESFFKKQKTG